MIEDTTQEREPQQGELIQAGSAAPVPVRKEGILRQLLTSPSKWPFLNRFSKKSIESARDVVEAQNNLVGAVVALGESCGQLDDMGLILAKDHHDRETANFEAAKRHNAARLENDTWEKDKKIYTTNKDAEVKRAEHEAQKEELERRKAIADLKKQVDALEVPEKKPRGTPASRAKAEREKEIRRFEKEKDKIQRSGDTAAVIKRLLKEATSAYEQNMAAIEAKYKKEA